MVFEVLRMMENSGSTIKMDETCPFENVAHICKTTRCDYPKGKRIVTCDVCCFLIEYKWSVLMHNCVGITEYERVVLTCLRAGLFLRKLFDALAFVCIILLLCEGMA
jgi:hypothetical protein